MFKIEPDSAVHVHDGSSVVLHGAKIPGVTSITVVGKQIPGCNNCGLIDCGCDAIKNHTATCRYRVAVTCPIGFSCKDHGLDVCPSCDACDCKTS